MSASVTFLKPGLDCDRKKSLRAARVYILTIVYCKHWEGNEPDFEAFVGYINSKLEHFLKNEVFECIQADDERLVRVRPEINSQVGLERNSQGRLHHHVQVQLIYPRYERSQEDAKRKGFKYILARMNLGAALLQKWVRESYGKEFCEVCPLKIHVSSGINDDAFAMKEYSEKCA